MAGRVARRAAGIDARTTPALLAQDLISSKKGGTVGSGVVEKR